MRIPLLVAIALLCVVPLRADAAPDVDPKESWKLPKTEADKWATRIRRLLPNKGWTVTIRGNDIVIERDKKVEFLAYLPSMSRLDKPLQYDEPYRLTLRFGRKVSQDQYEAWVVDHQANDKRIDELRDGIRDITHKADDYLPDNDEQKARLKKYRDEVAKLVWHELPDLYCTDYSVQIFRSWWAGDVHGEAADECNAVKKALLQFFGIYDVKAAKDDYFFLRQEPKRK